MCHTAVAGEDYFAVLAVCSFPQVDTYPDSSPGPAPHELQHHRGAFLHRLDR